MTNRQIRRITEKEERRSKGKRPDKRAGKDRASLLEFLSEVRQELKRVSWPSRQEIITFTTVTLITTISLTLIVFAMDIVFKRTILELIRNL
ncbi:MAG: preprotein translocase subunit SecE [Acidimicrobiia bacterium]|nr:preprotein translocase subunit SecE [Acidimicrobiia bacterium]